MNAANVMGSGKPPRVMFDTNAYDAIAAAGDADRIAALVAAGALIVVTTPVQEDEIRQIRSPRRRQALLAVFRRIGGTGIDPAAVIGGDLVPMTRDDMLARAAEACCDMLVTEDRALAQRCPKAVSYAAFATAVL